MFIGKKREVGPVVDEAVKLEIEPSPRTRSTTYPTTALPRCIELARALWHLGASGVRLEALAEELNMSPGSGSFMTYKSAAKQFGLVSYSGDYISLEPQVSQALSEDDMGNHQPWKALLKDSVRRPPLYRKLMDRFSGRQLPPNSDILARSIAADKDLGIVREASQTAAKVFIESVKHAGLVDERNFLRDSIEDAADSVADGTVTLAHSAGGGRNDSMVLPEAIQGVVPASQQAASDLEDYRLMIGGRQVHLLLPSELTEGERDRLIGIIKLIPIKTDA